MTRPSSRLGRVPVPAARGAPSQGGGRRRRRRSRALAVLVGLAAVPFVWAALAGPDGETGRSAGAGGGAPDRSAPDTTGAPSPDVGPGPGSPPAVEAPSSPELAAVPGVLATPELARFEGVVLHQPSPSPVVVGFHEAATVLALGLEPIGALSEDRNTTRTDLPADVAGGTPYLVLSSRGRAAAPTSAMDIVLEPGDPVLAPVTGTVVDVRGYLLYGAHADLRVEIAPDGRPDLRVVLIHLDEVAVEVGDRVTGGVTLLAGTARGFPFGSHIDRETEPDRFPHVHLELQPVDAPRPGDPSEDDPDEGRGPRAAGTPAAPG